MVGVRAGSQSQRACTGLSGYVHARHVNLSETRLHGIKVRYRGANMANEEQAVPQEEPQDADAAELTEEQKDQIKAILESLGFTQETLISLRLKKYREVLQILGLTPVEFLALRKLTHDYWHSSSTPAGTIGPVGAAARQSFGPYGATEGTGGQADATPGTAGDTQDPLGERRQTIAQITGLLSKKHQPDGLVSLVTVEGVFNEARKQGRDQESRAQAALRGMLELHIVAQLIKKTPIGDVEWERLWQVVAVNYGIKPTPEVRLGLAAFAQEQSTSQKKLSAAQILSGFRYVIIALAREQGALTLRDLDARMADRGQARGPSSPSSGQTM